MKKWRWIWVLALLAGTSAGMFAGNGGGHSVGNPAGMLKDRRQVRTVESLKELAPGRLFRLDYRADYRLQDFVEADLASKEAVQGGVATLLLDESVILSSSVILSEAKDILPLQDLLPLQIACSAFQAVTPEGDVIYGRNFDYPFDEGSAIVMRTRPRGAYRSLSLVSMDHVGLSGPQLSDGVTDLSMLVAAPYAMMDGMNEKGLAVSVLALTGGGCACQYETGKHTVMTTVLMRLLLDRAATVDEAVALCQSFNFFADGEQRRVRPADKTNYHFLLSDASGRSVVLEYIREGGLKSQGSWVLNMLDQRYVTNFYLSDDWQTVIRPDKRYDRLAETLSAATPAVATTASAAPASSAATGTHVAPALSAARPSPAAVLTEAEAMALLQSVYQKAERKGDVRTHWSVVYNLTRRTATICPAGDFSHPRTLSLRPRDWR